MSSNAFGNPPRDDDVRQPWNNDPNNYGTQNQGSYENDRPGLQPGFEDQGLSRREGALASNAAPGAQWTAGHGDSLGNTGYQGNTTDSNVPDAGSGNWQGDTPTSSAYDVNNQGTGQPSMGQRVKGASERMAGKVTGNTGMQQCGQQRQTGAHYVRGNLGR
ncbi:hypothetical protein FOMPIDRAFT_1013482 [Fomitopsis schrenkii]|uniref:Uncharacterized protein n=1 Tax=Fomitopsis schrenkii TaxID=2126942 RepID=S8FVK6_FOMSC|nr:hypothetical protein FOMPIDRAFT_1013482 [Fomitopsis schrenkii]